MSIQAKKLLFDIAAEHTRASRESNSSARATALQKVLLEYIEALENIVVDQCKAVIPEIHYPEMLRAETPIAMCHCGHENISHREGVGRCNAEYSLPEGRGPAVCTCPTFTTKPMRSTVVDRRVEARILTSPVWERHYDTGDR